MHTLQINVLNKFLVSSNICFACTALAEFMFLVPCIALELCTEDTKNWIETSIWKVCIVLVYVTQLHWLYLMYELRSKAGFWRKDRGKDKHDD